MIITDEGALLTMPAATTATNATQSMVFSTLGYDYCNLYVNVGTHATNGASIGTLKITESDTSTVISSQSAIVALTGGTATSTSVGFVIPGASTAGNGQVIPFQIDLRKRKLYLGLQITPGTTTMNIGAIAVLRRSNESADSAAEKAAVTNYASTSQTSCSVVVKA